MKRRNLSRKRIREVVRRVEQTEGIRLGAFPKVTFSTRKRHPLDYGAWKGSLDLDGGFRRLKVRLYNGVPPDTQALVLEHEVRESLRRLKGESTSEAHDAALRAERAALRQLPYRTSDGKPYQRSGALLKRLDPSRRRSSRGTPSPLWRVLRGWLGW